MVSLRLPDGRLADDTVASVTADLVELRTRCAALDRSDPLARFRDEFALPEGVIYLDGNSLGPLLKVTSTRVAHAVERDWGEGLIGSWNHAGWVDLPITIGDKIGRLIGARQGEVIATDSTSVNIFKALSAALSLRPGRPDILIEADDFPTDAYIAEGVLTQRGEGGRLRFAARGDLAASVDDRTGALVVCQVNYRTGQLHDLAEMTRSIQRAGALVCWDLSHSVGALPIDLGAAGADFAVGCGYKFLNGGPGAPAFVFAAARHLASVRQPLSGWFGHATPFEFSKGYEPGPGILRFACGTPSILGLVALESGVDLALGADLGLVRAKSVALSELLIELVESRCARHHIDVLSPRDPALRGSQVSLALPNAYEVGRALIERGVIGDFRPPNILRFGITPLYVGFLDILNAVLVLAEVLDTEAWDRPEFRERLTVT